MGLSLSQGGLGDEWASPSLNRASLGWFWHGPTRHSSPWSSPGLRACAGREPVRRRDRVCAGVQRTNYGLGPCLWASCESQEASGSVVYPTRSLGGRGPGGAGAPGGGPGVCVRGLTGPTLSSDLVCGPSMSPRRPEVQWFRPPEQFALCDWGAAGSPSGVGPGCVRGQTGATLSSDLVCGSSWSPRRPAVQWFRPPEQFGVCGWGGCKGARAGAGPARLGRELKFGVRA